MLFCLGIFRVVASTISVSGYRQPVPSAPFHSLSFMARCAEMEMRARCEMAESQYILHYALVVRTVVWHMILLPTINSGADAIGD
jgi:hypothetical protein